MRIAVLGTGVVGRTLAGALAGLGHEVVMGTRDPQATFARSAPDALGAPPFSEWHAANQHIPLETFADAAAASELVVNATKGAHAPWPSWAPQDPPTSPTKSWSMFPTPSIFPKACRRC